MKTRLFLLLAPLLIAAANAQLVVTEINSNGTPADFWELTNFGENPVDLSNFRWDDDSANPADPAAFTIPAGTTISAGESVVFAVGVTAAEFRAAWNLPESLQVISGGSGLGLDDAVHLYNALSAPVASLNYAAGGFTRSNGATALGGHAGVSAGGAANQSLILDPNTYSSGAPRRYTFASGSNFETFAANAPFDAVGSPGKIGVAGSNSLPIFTSPTTTYWRTGTALTNSTYRVTAVDTDPGETVTISVVAKPAWMTLTAVNSSTYRLGGTPPAAGDYTFTLRVTDNAPQPGINEQTFTLTAFPTTSPIILNEYNAVGGNEFLRGGDATKDEVGVAPGPRDSFYGRIPGNGGQWVEFVVVGNGTAGSVVDMRGWTIEILGSTGTRSIQLSDDLYWSNVIAGTILTFTASNSANGGLDTQIHRHGALHTLGYVWSNVWMFDPNLTIQRAGDFTNDVGIDSNDTRFVVKNNTGTVIYGPAGEGVASSTGTTGFPDAPIGVNSREVVRLQENPLPAVDPLFGAYNDADSSSSFGAPNSWGSTPTVQSFAAFVRPNSPPRFTSVPVTRAMGDYQYTITTTDPNGNVVALSAPVLPDFLALVPGANGTATLTSNRPLTLADAGEHTVRIIASDGGSVAEITPQVFTLTVFNSAPSVILNEFNAVAGSNFLNGGTALVDSDGGPASADSHFGRILGNGGQWFELVVVGDGGASTVDLRGWSIEIANASGSSFAASNVLKLSQDDSWSAVPAGTILTFIDRNTANGGLDTQINRRNQRSTAGDAWTNVWIGDPELLVYTGPGVNGYTLGDGVVSGLRVDNFNTQFVLKNAAGQWVFGPAGEGIAPLSGVSSTEIFELKNHPSPEVIPWVVATDVVLGYDESGSSSTFGHPNRWPDGAGETVQDFSPFVTSLTPYDTWAASFDLSGESAGPVADPDADGRSNHEEYSFGGNPTVADAAPVPQRISRSGTTVSWQYLRRAGDPGLQFSHEQSTDLQNWTEVPAAQLQFTTTDHPTLTSYELVEVEISATSAPEQFFRVRVP